MNNVFSGCRSKTFLDPKFEEGFVSRGSEIWQGKWCHINTTSFFETMNMDYGVNSLDPKVCSQWIGYLNTWVSSASDPSVNHPPTPVTLFHPYGWISHDFEFSSIVSLPGGNGEIVWFLMFIHMYAWYPTQNHGYHVHGKAPSTVQGLLPCWNFDLATVKETILYARGQTCPIQTNEWGEPVASYRVREVFEVFVANCR